MTDNSKWPIGIGGWLLLPIAVLLYTVYGAWEPQPYDRSGWVAVLPQPTGRDTLQLINVEQAAAV